MALPEGKPQASLSEYRASKAPFEPQSEFIAGMRLEESPTQFDGKNKKLD